MERPGMAMMTMMRGRMKTIRTMVRAAVTTTMMVVIMMTAMTTLTPAVTVTTMMTTVMTMTMTTMMTITALLVRQEKSSPLRNVDGAQEAAVALGRKQTGVMVERIGRRRPVATLLIALAPRASLRRKNRLQRARKSTGEMKRSTRRAPVRAKTRLIRTAVAAIRKRQNRRKRRRRTSLAVVMLPRNVIATATAATCPITRPRRTNR